MGKHLEREIEKLKKKILFLSYTVKERVRDATLAIENHDEQRAQKVIDTDPEIDQMEIEVEEDCLKILALHQPVAIDLRFIIAVLKINNDLERIGDLAVNIAERAVFLAGHPDVAVPVDLVGMAQKVKAMLDNSLDALVNMNAEQAHHVCAADDEVDNINRDIFLKVNQALREYPDQIESLIHLLSASRHLERIADQTTNIAEDVIYMITGEIVRHKTEDYRENSS